MNMADPVVQDILRRSMVARIATLSRGGRPSVNPLYFIHHDGVIWLGTVVWTLAVRNVKANSRVSMLFNVERDTSDKRVLRVDGQSSVQLDNEALRAYNLRVARKYVLTPGGLYNWLTHPRQLRLRRYYVAQNVGRGRACLIEVVPDKIELFTGR